MTKKKSTPAKTSVPKPGVVVPPGYATGLIPRNYTTHPVGCFSFAPAFPDSELIPESQWAGWLAANRANKAGLLDLREANYDILHSLDQNGYGLCWAFSSTKTVMYLRMKMNEPGMRMSAYYVAGKVKNWQDEGWFGYASLEYIVSKGVPVESLCPKYSRSYDTKEAADNALFHRVTEWWDGSDNPTKAQKQLISSLLKGMPCVVDLNVMGHSMCAIDIGSLNPLEIIYDNSWGDGGEKGLYRGRGAYARPDGLSVPRVTMPSVV